MKAPSEVALVWLKPSRATTVSRACLPPATRLVSQSKEVAVRPTAIGVKLDPSGA